MRKMHAECSGLFVSHNDFLPSYMLELCEQGIIVMMQILSRKASDLCQYCHIKSDCAKSLIVNKWLKAW